jgi:hypothetical protein
MPVYKDSSNDHFAADANAGSGAEEVVGIALTNADNDEYFIIQTGGDINIGATTVQGELYVLSGTKGAIAPASDIASGWYPVALCTAEDTSGNCKLGISVGEVAKA